MMTPYYVFNEQEFINNYITFEQVFKKQYQNYHVAYSYKTNYTPYVCSLIRKLGGYAEVVSKMEYELAKSLGYDDERIIFNGPSKEVYPNCILNIDSLEEIKNTGNNRIGIRINIDVGQGFVSRFGLEESELDQAFEIAKNRIIGLHCHVSQARSLKAWEKRVETMLRISDRYFGTDGPKYIDLGSGMYADMQERLRNQFDNVPTYEDYAKVVAGQFSEHYKDGKKPILFTEPGTTLINRYFEFRCVVESIKHIRGKTFVVLNGSKHNLGEICELKNLPIEIIHSGSILKDVTDADFVGYTCLEHDVMLRHFSGKIGLDDTIIFKNVGGYSIVSKPPFIRPNYPVYTNNGKLIKRVETFEEIFATYE